MAHVRGMIATNMWLSGHIFVATMNERPTLPAIRLFGSAQRTAVLVLLALVEESYTSEIVRLLDAPRYSIQRIINDFEREGLIASRAPGVERRISLNRQLYFYAELVTLLKKIGNANPEYLKIISTLRRRPRRTGKPLELPEN